MSPPSVAASDSTNDVGFFMQNNCFFDKLINNSSFIAVQILADTPADMQSPFLKFYVTKYFNFFKKNVQIYNLI